MFLSRSIERQAGHAGKLLLLILKKAKLTNIFFAYFFMYIFIFMEAIYF